MNIILIYPERQPTRCSAINRNYPFLGTINFHQKLSLRFDLGLVSIKSFLLITGKFTVYLAQRRMSTTDDGDELMKLY
jgi:hypothetical protein